MSIVHSTSMTGSTIVAATIDMTVKLGITLPKSILLKIDQRRGDIARSRYIRRAVENYLSKNTAKSNYNENKSTVTKKKEQIRK
jgi:metal-responsive CopG/Arc/MetJ family transcriptional regulator